MSKNQPISQQTHHQSSPVKFSTKIPLHSLLQQRILETCYIQIITIFYIQSCKL